MLRLFVNLFSGVMLLFMLAIAAAEGIGHGTQVVIYRMDSSPCLVIESDPSHNIIIHYSLMNIAVCPANLTWSADYHRVAVEYELGNVLEIGLVSQREFNLKPVLDRIPIQNGSLSWSPDSQQLAFVFADDTVTTIGIVTMKPDATSEIRRFPIAGTQPLSYGAPAWSPDGQFIAVAADIKESDGRNSELFTLRVTDGTVQRLTNSLVRDDSPAWSPDGAQIVFVSTEDDYAELHLINVATKERHQLTYGKGGCYFPAWSPDGSMIAFLSGYQYLNVPYVINANGTNLRRLPANGNPITSIAWLP